MRLTPVIVFYLSTALLAPSSAPAQPFRQALPAQGPERVEGDIRAITRPSEDVTLSFVRPGRIAQMLVKEGDDVKAAQVLAQQDDAAEKVQLAQLRAQADDTVRVRAAEAQLEQKRVEYGKLQEAFEKKAVSKWDVERARVEVTIGELSLELAKFQHQQDALKYEDLRLQVERMRMLCPVDGRVEKVLIKAGEAADQNEDVVRIVKVNPLWIEVPAPLRAARALKTGSAATVEFHDGLTPPAEGRIVHIGAVADAASDTLNVRVELPNPAGRPAGEHVTVRFR